MRDVLILGAAARHRPTDENRRAGPMVQAKLWRSASGRNLRTRSKWLGPENSLRDRR
jgi:hypothetical protein